MLSPHKEPGPGRRQGGIGRRTPTTASFLVDRPILIMDFGKAGNLNEYPDSESHILGTLSESQDPRILQIYVILWASSHRPLDRHPSRFENNGF